MKVEKNSLRNQVRDAIAAQIFKGSIAGGSNLNEAAISHELGVSRTPLREGLLLLEAEGLVTSKANHGFFVSAVSKEMVHEIYTILGSLEVLALRLTNGNIDNLINSLTEVNTRLLKETTNRKEQHRLDSSWHEILLSQCGNQTLLDTVSRLKRQAYRFDGAFERGTANHIGSCKEHADITHKLQTGYMEDAAIALEHHWKAGITVVTNWIAKQS